MDGWSGVLI